MPPLIFGGPPKRAAPHFFIFPFINFEADDFRAFGSDVLKGTQILSFEARDISSWMGGPDI